MTPTLTPTFAGPAGTFTADTCAPLRGAATSGQVELAAYGRATYPGVHIDDDVLPQLNSVGSWIAPFDQDWGLDWHRNEGIEFTCVTAGSVSFSCETEVHELEAGDVTITRPWQLHRVGGPNVTSSTLTWFIVDVEVRRPNQAWNWPAWLPIVTKDLDRLTELLSHNERPVWRAGKSLLGAVTNLERTLRGEVTQPMSRIAASVTEVLIELGDLLERQSPPLNPYLSSTERMVRMFLSGLADRIDEPWTVDEMASSCGLGRTRFIHYSRQICNLSPLEYLTNLRLQRAATLLAQTEFKVSDIAAICGFQSGQYFATTFRRRFHRSPVEHRRAHQVVAETPR
jgi:AraC-like DNA-binding protein